MAPQPATIVALLPHARDLVNRRNLDFASILKLLDALPMDDLNVSTHAAVRHARLAAANVGISTSHKTVARYALARLTVLLERQVAVFVS